jgi:hypothetical protein
MFVSVFNASVEDSVLDGILLSFFNITGFVNAAGWEGTSLLEGNERE